MRSVHSVPGSQDDAARSGFSLIEVIMATAILLGSAVLLSRLAGLGKTHAQNTKKLAEVQRICENTLNEFVLGIRPLSPVESAPLISVDQAVPRNDDRKQNSRFDLNQGRLPGTERDAHWLHSVRIKRERRTRGLVSLTVQVSEARRSNGQRISYSLTRWIHLDPQKIPLSRFNAADDRSLRGVN